MAYTNIDGQIPSEIGNLHSLVTLELHHNRRLGTTIPPSIGRLTSLKILAFYDFDDKRNNEVYNISGIIPSEIGQLISLTQLFLSNCRLSGTIHNWPIDIS
jgi:Leucine-rich repeat (LRR) protein